LISPSQCISSTEISDLLATKIPRNLSSTEQDIGSNSNEIHSAESPPSVVEAVAGDFLSSLPDDDFEVVNQIFSYLRGGDLMNLCAVSKKWREIVENSPIAMGKIVFNYNYRSKNELWRSFKRLKHIKARQEFVNFDQNFLSKILRFYSSLESISFIGTFTVTSVERFFERLQRKLIQLPCRIRHLSFTGSFGNLNIEMESFRLFLEKFYSMFGKEHFATITLCEVSSITFAKVIPNLCCKMLELINMRLVNAHRQINNHSIPNISVEKLKLISSTIDYDTLKAMKEVFPVVDTVLTTVLTWKSWSEDMKELVDHWMYEELFLHVSNDLIISLPSELHPFIFQHLDHDELKTISKVSEFWFEATKPILSAMSMYKLVDSTKRRRKYHAVMMELHDDFPQKINLIRPFLPDLRDLMFTNGETILKNSLNFFSLCRFENLTWLRLVSSNRDPIDDFDFSTCPALQELHLDVFKFSSETPQETRFIKYLLNASQLEVLSFVDCKYLKRMFVNETLSTVPFKLKTLRMPIISRLNETICKNFNTFLMTQSNTLKELFLYEVDRTALQNIIDHFQLEALGFFKTRRAILTGSCKSLKHLQLRFKELKSLKKYLTLAPNMEILTIPELNDDILKFLKENYQSIKKIQSGKNKLENESLGSIEHEWEYLEIEEFDVLNNDDVHGYLSSPEQIQ
jgi:hypothetical protein